MIPDTMPPLLPPARKHRLWHLAAQALAASGTLLAADVVLRGCQSTADTGFSGSALLFYTYILLPWLLLDALYLRLRLPRSTALAAGLGLLVEGEMYWSVFIAPGGSTAGLGYLFKTLLQAVLMIPGLALGGLADRAAASAPGKKEAGSR